MAYIKCKYQVPYCRIARHFHDCEFNEYVCFSVYDYASAYCTHHREADNEVIGSRCVNVEYRTYLIEKEVKSYELTDTELHFRGNYIYVNDMLELVIDGKEYAFKHNPDLDQYLPPQVIDWEESEKTNDYEEVFDMR